MTQRTFFDDEFQRDQAAKRGVPPEEEVRLSRQCKLILERLRKGPVSNVELAKIALKYTSRISDLRKAGYTIEAFKRDHLTGIVHYILK